ncbi:MFS transporter [Amycolatopsis sp. NPDC050768]|uniref:MFS transporter n=1 Tax=Amycolatopsis sp. NPDC050768 TaxID=3154839 RepID=UPI0033C5B2C2
MTELAVPVFRLPGFRRLLAGRSVSFLATALVPTALTLAVINATGSAGDLGLVLAAELVPQLALLPVGGVLADRLPAQRVAFAADLLRGLAQLGIGAELLLGFVRITDLIVLSAITGVGIAFGTPTMSPLVSAVVPGDARLAANGHLGVARGIALVAGPGIAGVLVVTVGAGWSFVVTGVLFGVAAATLRGVRTPPRNPAAPSTSFFRELADGWYEVRTRPWFWTNLLGHAVANLAAGALMTLGPLIAVRSLGGEVTWVVVYQAGMAGLVAGALAAPRLRFGRPLVATSVCGALFALPLVAFAVPVEPWGLAVAYGVGMLGIGTLNTVWQTTMQRHFPPTALARADSYDALLSFSARPLGLAVAAPVAELTGVAAPLVTLAVLVVAVHLVILALPDVRSISASGPRRNRRAINDGGTE